MTFVAFSLDTKGSKVVDSLAENEHLLHLTKAVLVKGTQADLIVTDTADTSHVIAVLDNKSNRMVNLELIFNKTGHALSIKGDKGSTVHISGYQEPSPEIYPSMEESMDTEELARLNEECSDDLGALARGDPKPTEEELEGETISSEDTTDSDEAEDISPKKFVSSGAKESKTEALAELVKDASRQEESSDESGSEDSDGVPSDVDVEGFGPMPSPSVTDEDSSSNDSDDNDGNDDDEDSSSSSTPESVNKLLLGLSENMPDSDSDSDDEDDENDDSSSSSEEPPAVTKATVAKSKSKSPKSSTPVNTVSSSDEEPQSRSSSSSSPSSRKRQRNEDSGDSSDTSSEEVPPVKVVKKQKIKESDKATTKGKDSEKLAKGSKTTSGKPSTPEDQFESDLLKYLKANGRTALTVLGTKVKKPAAVKSKLGAFVRSRNSVFLLKDDQVESK